MNGCDNYSAFFIVRSPRAGRGHAWNNCDRQNTSYLALVSQRSLQATPAVGVAARQRYRLVVQPVLSRRGLGARGEHHANNETKYLKISTDESTTGDRTSCTNQWPLETQQINRNKRDSLCAVSSPDSSAVGACRARRLRDWD